MVQNKIEDVLAWRNPVETISAMVIFSLFVINPQLAISLPFFIVVFALLIPSYESRHPPPPMSLSSASLEVTQAISPAPQTGKPAQELSRDFFMNMRDIQNSMDDFSNAYDLIRGYVLYITTFRDEPLSSTVLAFSTIGCLAMMLFVQFLPMRFIVLIAGNAAILACHPFLFKYIITNYIRPEEIERIKQRIEQFVKDDYIPPPPSQNVMRTVEIFEWRRLLPPAPGNHLPDWSDSRFSPFPPQAANSTEKLSAISSPDGYIFGRDEWKIDVDKEKWATERGMNDDTGFWIVDGDEFQKEGDGWVVYEAGGWKVRRLTRAVVRAVQRS